MNVSSSNVKGKNTLNYTISLYLLTKTSTEKKRKLLKKISLYQSPSQYKNLSEKYTQSPYN